MVDNRHSRRKLVRERARATSLRQPSLRRVLLFVLAMVALSIQVLVLQTHIHVPQAAGRAETVSLSTLFAAALADKPHAAGDTCSANTPRDKYPINEDPSNCPLGQELAHSGVFVASAAALVSLPVTVTVNFIVFDEVLPSFLAVSHAWRGRAPPQS